MEPVLEKVFEDVLVKITTERDSRRNVKVKSVDQLILEKERLDKRIQQALEAEKAKKK
jgi:hypothetical protein